MSFDHLLPHFSFWEYLAVANVAGWIGFWIRTLIMRRHMPNLMDFAPQPHTFPRVSVIVPARNEAKRLQAALQTLLSQRYPNFEIIAINDRSTDCTGEILDSLAQTHTCLKVIHVQELPEGWLGKNYANYLGYQHSSGEYLLFTDADIFFHPETLVRTVTYALRERAKHIVAYPKMLTSSAMEEAFIALFGFLFTWKFSPSGARNPKNRHAYIGVGAFNFIERSLYERIGTHLHLRANVDDDVKLGYWVKQHAEATHVVRGTDLLAVRWREGLWDSIKGIERSAFPGINFSWLWVGIGIVGTLFGLIAPYWLLFMPSALITLCAGSSIAMIFLIYFTLIRNSLRALRITLLHPVASLLFLYALISSAVKITWQGGVEWRGTFYSLALLKKKALTDTTSAHATL
ncbi:MAG: glycosyltransferase [Candidatus Thermochlorobacter aerophilum]|jgi:glycosyltransferase involved in cell wall biosynthesis|uniref:Glycosyltransferase n=1 Tax=Candidatus Thermochlorobacter aerophilus TaxID=1868324 RepID=A0A395M1Q1_9BACT|nr:MAG: glycosyltransferase [Candidatus Thermochlorobacter aerophilum]